MPRTTEVAIPERMKHLPLDPRGYPIFYVAFRDKDKAIFTINDSTKLVEVAAKDLCEICGKKLFRGRWFIGGPGSAFHQHGAYIDAPMHDECAHYALKVCPWLAAPNYRSISELQAKQVPGLVTKDNSDPRLKYRPPIFVAVMTIGQSIEVVDGAFHFKPQRPYRRVECWLHGQMLSEAEARPWVEDYMKTLPTVGV